jgi:hypothetical protein
MTEYGRRGTICIQKGKAIQDQMDKAYSHVGEKNKEKNKFMAL